MLTTIPEYILLVWTKQSHANVWKIITAYSVANNTSFEQFKNVSEQFKTVSEQFKTVSEQFKNVSEQFKNVLHDLVSRADNQKDVTNFLAILIFWYQNNPWLPP